MSLKTKILIIVVLVGIVYISSDFIICRFLVFPKFIKLEQIEAQRDVDRTVAAIEREIYHLDQFTTDWAYWDDAYLFIKNRNNEFIASNLSAISVFSENNLNLICFFDLEGNVVWGKTFDLENDSGLEPFNRESVLKISFLIHDREDQKSKSGFLVTKYGVFIISSAPILKSNLDGPANGTLIMGRIINKNDIQTLSEQTKLDLMLWNVSDNTIPDNDKEILSEIEEDKEHKISIKQMSASFLQCHMVFYDLNNEPALLARISIPRDIAKQGENAVFFTTFSIIVAGTIFVFLLLFLLNSIVSRPISILTNNVIQASDGSRLDLNSTSHRTDEIGILTKEFNSLIEKLDNEIADHKNTISELKTALSEIKTLRGLLPICSHCKKIRDDRGLWNKIEAYISQHSQAEFSHGICPDCIRKYYIKDFEKFPSKKA